MTPQTAKPAPNAITRVFKIPIADVKNVIHFTKTAIKNYWISPASSPIPDTVFFLSDFCFFVLFISWAYVRIPPAPPGWEDGYVYHEPFVIPNSLFQKAPYNSSSQISNLLTSKMKYKKRASMSLMPLLPCICFFCYLFTSIYFKQVKFFIYLHLNPVF